MAFFFSKVFVLLLFSLSKDCLAQQTTNNGSSIAVGTSLTATDNSSPWLSPSGDFAFGFRKLNTTGDLFLLSIWFAKISDETTVWFANQDHSPATSPRGSTLTITETGLVLTDPRGRETWRTDSIMGRVSNAALTDQGNFILRDRTSVTLWQSFNSPTDTLLPSQSLSRRSGSLWSRHSETNLTRGKFQLLLQTDGNLILTTINLPTEDQNSPYFATATNGGGSEGKSPGKEVEFNETTKVLYVVRESGERVLVGDAVSDPRQYYWRVTLGFDGILSQYSYPKNSSSSESQRWTAVWSKPDNICLSVLLEIGAGVCGHNSVCRLKENQKNPRCECPKGYSLLDPGYPFGDCKPDFVHGCAEDALFRSEDLYEIEVLVNIDWPFSDYTELTPFTETQCQDSCLQDCLCSAAIFRDRFCWKKRLPLSNGRYDSSLNTKVFLKVRKPQFFTALNPNQTHPAFPDPGRRPDGVSPLFAASAVFNALLAAVLICLGLVLLRRRRRNKSSRRRRQDQYTSLFCAETNVHRFGYMELEEATEGFKEELGRGAFGVVYKGMLGPTAVAVKRLSREAAPETEKEFRNEVNAIGRTHHKNLVRLLGYCNEGPNRLLVYEYIGKGTLASHVFSGDNEGKRPSWKWRRETAVGVARGLLYLHEECGGEGAQVIIHCDVKPQNILIDNLGNPRISDFGLARLTAADNSGTMTAIRGTKGYVAPEWFRNMPVTAKVDVYSFGVVLLEMICCRRSVEGEEAEILTDWAYDCYREGCLEVLVNGEVEALEDRERLERFVMVSMWCIQESPSSRPNMRTVVQMLEGTVQIPLPPSPFSFLP